MSAAVFLGPHQADTNITDKVASLEALLKQIAAEFQSVRLASSLAAEDNVLLDAVARLKLKFAAFTLNTGRLNEETIALIPELTSHYGVALEVFEPIASDVNQYVQQHGQDAFYNSVDLRKACCNIRKVEPLNRALKNADAWVTGQRRAQSATRAELNVREQDAARGITKFNPLADWSEADVWTYVRQFSVPVNALHFQGYPSIGCAPCTRGISIGEEIRAGRWWWEDPTSKECGLHVTSSTLPHTAES